MVPQGVLDFQYEAERSNHGQTAFGGLPLYLDLIWRSGAAAAIRQYVCVAGRQGWLDLQLVLAVLFLNLAGGDCIEDLERLEGDSGFAGILKKVERAFLTRRERRTMKARWRRERERAVPSPSSMSGWLERFHDLSAPKAEAGRAFIPAVTAAIRGLWKTNQALIGFVQVNAPSPLATLDMDATLIATHKRDALYCYKGFKAYQPLNCWWAEQSLMLYSEFRDGNVPAGHEQLRVLKDSLQYLPASVTKVALRSDSAGYQEELLLYCGEGRDPRFGVIEFAIAADVTEAFRRAVLATAESEWKPLVRMFDGQPQQTEQEWAEIGYVPHWAGHSKKRADYRFLAIREPLRELPLGDEASLPFPTQAFGTKGTYKLFGVVTNKKEAGDQVIWWLRERCGKSEEVHAVLKTDLAGGQLPSALFGANAAWWALAILAHNLNTAMKKLVLGKSWVTKRMKALRFHLIALPGRVVRHARKLIIRLGAGAETLAMIVNARQTIRALRCGPAG
jgi:Transposase DDE domain group 1